jgi:hypothetical protein
VINCGESWFRATQAACATECAKPLWPSRPHRFMELRLERPTSGGLRPKKVESKRETYFATRTALVRAMIAAEASEARPDSTRWQTLSLPWARITPRRWSTSHAHLCVGPRRGELTGNMGLSVTAGVAQTPGRNNSNNKAPRRRTMLQAGLNTPWPARPRRTGVGAARRFSFRKVTPSR